jgi:hypothetical protein
MLRYLEFVSRSESVGKLSPNCTHEHVLTITIRVVYRARTHHHGCGCSPLTAVKGHSVLTNKHEYCFHTRGNKILSNCKFSCSIDIYIYIFFFFFARKLMVWR